LAGIQKEERITNRCSCPLKGRVKRWMQPGNSGSG
jgi:hypothetical protein